MDIENNVAQILLFTMKITKKKKTVAIARIPRERGYVLYKFSVS